MAGLAVRILTFNTWLLRLPLFIDIAKDIDQRKALIPRAIADTGADIVCFQENWGPGNRAEIRKAMLEVGFPYCAESVASSLTALPEYVPPAVVAKIFGLLLGGAQLNAGGLAPALLATAGVTLSASAAAGISLKLFRDYMGNGLQIFSKYPIESQVDTLVFSDFTRPDEVMVSKGAIRATVHLPGNRLVDVYNTHLGAVSFQTNKMNYHPTEVKKRRSQLKELMDWTALKRKSPARVLAGDFNSHFLKFENNQYVARLSEDYKAVRYSDEGWSDCFRQVHGYDNPGFTDSKHNPYKSSGHFQNTPDGALDYIFVSGIADHSIKNSEILFAPDSSSPTQLLSDHYAVAADLLLK